MTLAELRFMGRKVVTTWQVNAFAPPESFAFSVVTGPVPFEASYACEVVPEGRRLTVTGHAPMNGPLRWLEGVMSRSMTRRYAHDLERLKSVLESGTRGAAQGG